MIVRDTRRVEYAYPVYDRDYGKNTETIRDYFTSLGIEQLGRFAEFDYINSDECIHRAMKMAEGSTPRRDSRVLTRALLPRTVFRMNPILPTAATAPPAGGSAARRGSIVCGWPSIPCAALFGF